ncbi:MAG: Stp1/IreP family PP2C-type Ser/Thr phosphatase [Oscillospiraceae bacterium]|nr:Stp1/IreP family PP2C-type Ser/Thr phosphatase [Oscillospiraceae bacterium]
MDIWGITDRGKVRRQNQDAFYKWTNGTLAFAVVCDGMGGARSGNVASAMAAQRFVQALSAGMGTPEERLTLGAAVANDAVYHRAQRDVNCRGMGTTLVAAFAKADEAHILNIGDSRCYHLSDGQIWQVTRDHSLVAEWVAAGQLTEEEAQNHPNRNIITRALGTEEQVQGDLYRETLQPGDRLLLCSDGLSNEVTKEELAQRTGGGDLRDCCDRLLQLALERGAPDNVTAVILSADG